MRNRRFSTLWKVVIGVVVIAVAVMFLTYDDGATEAVAAEDRYETKAAEVTTLDELVTGSFTIEDRAAGTAVSVIHTSGIATSVIIETDDTPTPLAHLMDVDGEPVYALVGGTPFYREITEETSDGDDVRTLEDNLVAAGFEVGEVDGKADTDLSDAIKEWQKEEEREETGVFDPTSFVWFPSSYVVEDVLVDVGGVVTLQAPVVQLRKPGTLVATARIEQADVGKIRNGLDVALVLDGLSDIDLSGSIAEIDDRAELGTSDFMVEVAIDNVPDEVREGMKGEVEILVDRHRDVVVVPTNAVGGPVGAPSLRVLANGQVEVRTIRVGLVTPADTVVISGVAAGELVVVAEKEL